MSTARSLAAGLCAATVLWLGAPAYAESRTVRDPAGDIQLTDDDGVVGTAPDRAEADIRRMEVSYDGDTISGVVTYRELRRPTSRLELAVGLHWGPQEDAALIVNAHERRPQGHGVFGFPTDHCPAHYLVDYAHDRFTFTVPASCLHGEDVPPPWVQAYAMAFVGNPHRPGTAWFDIAPKGHSPRVHRG